MMDRKSQLAYYEIGALAAVLVFVLIITGVSGNGQIGKNEQFVPRMYVDKIATGYIGVIAGIDIAQATSEPYEALGTSVEDVLVGQRMTEREIDTLDNVGDQVKESVDDINEQSWEIAARTQMSDGDYETLLALVEAEAGGEDVEGRIMVANVVLNRINYEKAFPNNVTDVIWERVAGFAQFSPTYDGRINRVTVSDRTREAVNRVIDGEDLSQGALFFIAKNQAEERNIRWFNRNLKFLFEHGVHSFYTY